MNNRYLTLLIVFIFSLTTLTSCEDKDDINIKGSVDAAISSVTPSEAKPNYPITLSGNGFSNLKEVFFNNTQVLDFALVDDNTINLSVPNGTPVGDALITLVYSDNARVSATFNVLVSEPPTVTSYANVQDANNISFEGINFFDLTITLNGEEVTPNVNSNQTQLSFMPPSGVKNKLSGTLKISNLDGFENFKYVYTGDKIYFFKEGSYSTSVIEDWDGNGVGATWDGPHSGVTTDAGVKSSGPTGSYLKMTSSGESWGGGYEFGGVSYGLPEGVRGKNFYVLADMKFNNTSATGVYMIIQLEGADPQVIFYGDDLPEYTANPMFWSSIPIDPENATGEWQTIAWSQYYDFGPRYRNHADKTAADYPQNELRPEDSDNLATFKIQVPNDGLVDVDIDNVRIVYFN